MRIDFTTTATCRPDILCRTYSSFRDNLLGIELSRQRLFLNVDPIPDQSTAYEVIRIAKAFFGDVVSNIPREPCFGRAVRWCWLGPTTEMFFHLEDDWEMLRPFEMEEMVARMGMRPGRSTVSLRAYNCEDEDERISLCPGLFRTKCAREMALRLNVKFNPERQLRPVGDSNPIGGKHEGYTGIQIPRSVILKDIGREWLDSSGWRKTRPVTFNSWEPA